MGADGVLARWTRAALACLTVGLWVASWLPAAAAEPAVAKPSSAATIAASRKTNAARRIDWDILLPKSERANYSDEAPEPIHDYLGENGKAARQHGSIAVNAELDEKLVQIPGFVVPLVQDETGLVTVFFLVPYFGACIHVPPPPPNQIVYVKLVGGGGVRLGSPEEPYWITGVLHTAVNGTRVAKAAYTLDATRMERYKY
jgi:uncharacterized protein